MREIPSGAPSRNPLLSPLAILLAGIALSIGWGIRGNYGHETGAMFPGALTAIAVCALSGRQDWRERVSYFAFFGALGWAFGGSISYMQVIAYTQSGHAASQFYGYWGLFLIGFLWASLGVAGTALPAFLDRKSLCEMFKPLSLLLAIWTLWYFVEVPLLQMIQSQYESRFGGVAAAGRHESVLYWFDSDWLSVLILLIGILAFDLVDRRFSDSLWLPVFAIVGGASGYAAQLAIARLGWTDNLARFLVHPQGDPRVYDRERLITNWPPLFERAGELIGVAAGLILGVAAYFFCFGKFRRGSSLFLHLALGWFAGFLLLPVLLGIRMTPPRGDNWAGILGMVVAVLIYAARNNVWPLAACTLVGGTIGGIGFSGIGCLQALLQSFGNPTRAPGLAGAWTGWQYDSSAVVIPAQLHNLGSRTPQAWQFWQSANWHSFLEQSYGFCNGVAVIVALAVLATRLGRLDDSAKRQRWTEVLAVTLVVPVLLYVNLVKNVADWTFSNASVNAAVPPVMRVPLIGFPLSAWGWFNVLFGIAALAFVMLLSIHTRRPHALLEMNWLGRGQLLFLVLMWAFVIGNFGKALPHFREQRLLTEGFITVSAVIATMMILLLPRGPTDDLVEQIEEGDASRANPRRVILGSVVAAVICAAVIPPLETVCVRAVYGDASVRAPGDDGPETRFGPHALWMRKPLLKGVSHR